MYSREIGIGVFIGSPSFQFVEDFQGIYFLYLGGKSQSKINAALAESYQFYS